MFMTDSREQLLVSALRQLDIEVPVRQLYDQYFESILTQVSLSGGSREDGADIFQESVIVLIDKVKSGQFRGESSIRTFLSAIARNLWLTELRTRERRRKREELYSKGEELVTADENREPELISTGRLSALLLGIGEICKDILTGFYFQKKSMREMLEAFHYENEQVLRNKKSKCMKKLKELLLQSPELMENLKTQPLYER